MEERVVNAEEEMEQIIRKMQGISEGGSKENSDEGDTADSNDNNDENQDQTPDYISEEGAEEPESEEESEEEPEEVTDIFREKYYEEKKKRKGVYADRQKLADENHELKKMLNDTITSNSELYRRDLLNDLEIIKDAKKRAYAEGNADLYEEANEVYIEAMYKLKEFENSMRSSVPVPINEGERVNVDSYNDENDEYEDESEAHQAIAQAWILDRPELIPGSSSYNPKIDEELTKFTKDFNNVLRAEGRAHYIMSERYLEALDQYMISLKAPRKNDGYRTSNVGSVRNSSSNGSNTNRRVTLTAEDKEQALALNLTQEQFLKTKIMLENEKRNRR